MKNLSIIDWLIRVKNYHNNKRIIRLQSEFEEIDSIANVELLSHKVSEIKKTNGKLLQYKCINKESMYYGHDRMLTEYAGLKPYRAVYLPAIEHGINFSEDKFSEQQIRENAAFVFQGSYKNEMIHNVDERKHVYNIGPYILYAKNYYSSEKISTLHKKNGKTVVYFLFHTFESNNGGRSFERNIQQFKERYANEYDTLMICAYWLDLSPELLIQAEREGVKVVSAGARFDSVFMRRLKTIISLADLVVGDDIGSYVGYAIALGKRVEYIETTSHEEFIQNHNDVYSRNHEQLVDAMVNNRDKVADHCKRFWGDADDVKSPEEMREILQYTKQTVKKFHF